MGYNQMLAGDYFQYGATGEQAYQQFPRAHRDEHVLRRRLVRPAGGLGALRLRSRTPRPTPPPRPPRCRPASRPRTACIGVDVNGKPLYHVAQRAEALKKSTGVVTSVEWSHATPAGFVAHNASRNDYAAIANEMINDSGTDVIMGAGNPLYDDNGAPARDPEPVQVRRRRGHVERARERHGRRRRRRRRRRRPVQAHPVQAPVRAPRLRREDAGPRLRHRPLRDDPAAVARRQHAWPLRTPCR